MKNLFQKMINRAIAELKVKSLLYYKNDSKEKIEFETDIIELLKKYNIYDNATYPLQKVEIILEASNFPVIKLDTLVLKREK